MQIKYCLILVLLLFYFSMLPACIEQNPRALLFRDRHKANNLTKAAQYQVALGNAYLVEQRMRLAKQKFLLAYQEAPHSIVALDALANYYAKTGETKLARHYFLQALHYGPQSGRALNNYGVYLCQVGQNRLAIHYLLNAAHINSYLNTAQAYANAALCAVMIHDYSLASAALQQAVLQDPNRINWLLSLAKIADAQGMRQAAAVYRRRYQQLHSLLSKTS